MRVEELEPRSREKRRRSLSVFHSWHGGCHGTGIVVRGVHCRRAGDRATSALVWNERQHVDGGLGADAPCHAKRRLTPRKAVSEALGKGSRSARDEQGRVTHVDEGGTDRTTEPGSGRRTRRDDPVGRLRRLRDRSLSSAAVAVLPRGGRRRASARAVARQQDRVARRAPDDHAQGGVSAHRQPGDARRSRSG